jgi:hypothetical protein
MKKSLILLLCGICIFITGCATPPVTVPPQTPAQITAETITLVSNAYLLVPVANQAAFIKDANLVADELQLITSGALPIPANFENYLLSIVPTADQGYFDILVLGISGIYSVEYPKLVNNNPALVADINAFATGIKQGLPVAIRFKLLHKK